MTEIFVDAFFWLAVLNPRDPLHRQAVSFPKPPRAVTTRAVQIEVMDALSTPQCRGIAVQFWSDTNIDPDLLIVPLDDQLLSRAATLFENRLDKAWSITDCVSFVVMQERNITQALTHDRHFEQAGFQCLLRKP